MFWGGWAASLPDIRDAVTASDSAFGVALLGVGVGALPAMLAMGRIYDRYGARTMMPVLFAFALAAILPGAASSVLSLFVVLVVLGAMSGMVDVAINAAAAEWEVSGGSRVLNLAHASFSGFFLVASVSVGVARREGIEYHTILFFLALVVALAAVWNRAPGGGPQMGVKRPRPRFEARFLMLGALCGLAFVVEGGLESWSAVHLERTFGAGPAIGGLGPGLFAGAMVTGRILSHFIQAHARERDILVGGSGLAACGLLLAATAPAIPLALAGFVVAGLGTSVAAPTIFGLAGRGASQTERGSAISTITTVAYLGFLLGPPVVGWISGASSLRIGLGFLVLASLTLAALSGLLRGSVLAVPTRS